MFWQNLIVIMIVLGSVLYLGRKIYLSAKGASSGCGSACNGCSSNQGECDTSSSSNLVQLDSPKLKQKLD